MFTEGNLKLGFFEIYLTTSFANVISEIHKLRESSFCKKCSKLDVDFRDGKKCEKCFRLLDILFELVAVNSDYCEEKTC